MTSYVYTPKLPNAVARRLQSGVFEVKVNTLEMYLKTAIYA